MTTAPTTNVNSIHPCLLSSITDFLSEKDFQKHKNSVMQQIWMPGDQFCFPKPEFAPMVIILP